MTAPPGKERTAAFLLFATAAVVAFLGASDGDAESTITGFLLAGLGAIPGILLLIWPRGLIVTLARGVSAAVLVFTALMILLAPLLVRNAPLSLWASLFGLAALQVATVRRLAPDPARRTREFALSALMAVGTMFSIMFVYMFGAVSTDMASMVLSRPYRLADSVLTTSIPRVQACAIRFAKDGNGYPAALAAMGPPPAGSGCLDAEHASGSMSRGKVALVYEPGPPDSSGKVRSYRVTARGNTGFERAARIAFGDETGLYRAGNVADSLDPLWVQGALTDVRAVRACAEFMRARRRLTHNYPQQPDELNPTSQQDYESNARWLGCWPSHFPALNAPDSRRANHGTYVPNADSGARADYTLELRPRIYGVTGVRSIRTTARGSVHSTLEDRAATDDDPVVPTCEYVFVPGHCAPEPGGASASVRLTLSADTVAWGGLLRVTIEDTRPLEQRTHPYQYALICSHVADRNMKETPPAWSTDSVAECRPERGPERPDESAVRFVRVWVRDFATSETRFELKVYLRPE